MQAQNKRRQREPEPKERTALALAAYTAGFALVALAHAWPFIRDGRYFIYGADAYTQHFPAFCRKLAAPSDGVKEPDRAGEHGGLGPFGRRL